jgi:hypothetical protein
VCGWFFGFVLFCVVSLQFFFVDFLQYLF